MKHSPIISILLCSIFGITEGTAQQYVITSGTYSESDDWATAAVSEFGEGAVVVDWQDLKSAFATNQQGLTNLMNDLGMVKRNALHVTNNGKQTQSGSRAYHFALLEGDVPGGWLVHEQIFSNYLSLLSWPGNRRLLVSIPDSPDDYHPADINQDWSISVNELTKYASDWKNGHHDRIDYLARATYIWKNGETYSYDGTGKPVGWNP